jgi:hypothetical protein
MVVGLSPAGAKALGLADFYKLLGILDEICDVDGEDLAVWCGTRLLAIRHGNGQLTRLPGCPVVHGPAVAHSR